MDDSSRKQVLLIPCSGIGKVHGLLSREAVYRVTDSLAPDKTDTVCLALLVTEDADMLQRVRQCRCITVDGCPKLCAQKNVELSGGEITKGIRVYDILKRYRGEQFGTPTTLSDEGWKVVDDIAAQIAETVDREGA